MQEITVPSPDSGYSVKKLIPVTVYAKIKNITPQSVYERINRETLKSKIVKRDLKMVIIDEEDIPEKYKDKAIDIEVYN